MKYGPHPNASKHGEQMVYRGRGRTGVDVVRADVPVEAPAARPLPKVESPAKSPPEPAKRSE